MESRILTVAPGGAAQFSTIAEAMRAACDGDTILLKAGCYEEKVILDRAVHIVVDADAEPGDTIITSGLICAGPPANNNNNNGTTTTNNNNNTTTNNTVNNNNITLSTLSGPVVPLSPLAFPPAVAGTNTPVIPLNNNTTTATVNTNASTGGSQPGSPTSHTTPVPYPYGSIRNVVIHQTVEVRAGSTALIENCEITLGSDGVRVAAGACPTIRKCVIRQATGAGAGVYVQEDGSAIIEGCDIAECRTDGIHLKGCYHTIVRDCAIHHCANGIYARHGAHGSFENNVINNCHQFGIYVQSGSDPTVTGNTVEQCGVHAIFLSKEGSGSYKDNTVRDGSVRIYKGCTPTLGVNQFNGRFDQDMPLPV